VLCGQQAGWGDRIISDDEWKGTVKINERMGSLLDILWLKPGWEDNEWRECDDE